MLRPAPWSLGRAGLPPPSNDPRRVTSPGRWAFAEFTAVYDIESDFAAQVEQAFGQMLDATAPAVAAAC